MISCLDFQGIGFLARVDGGVFTGGAALKMIWLRMEEDEMRKLDGEDKNDG